VFFGGMLYDRLGPRKSSLLFCALVLLGAVIVAVAKTKWELFAGRLIFGAGSESLIFAPFAGDLVDRIGRRASLMVLGSLLMIPAHLALGLTHWSPIPSMVMLGASLVLVPAAMWPAVPLVVDESRVGTAFGLMTAIQNLGLALFPFLNGKLRDITGTYTATQVMFSGLGTLGLIFAFLLLRSDRRHGHVLERGRSSEKDVPRVDEALEQH
jgi:MFS family permease